MNDRINQLKELQALIQYGFQDLSLLTLALTHSSKIGLEVNSGKDRGNERLEFLGDSVLNLVMAEILYTHYNTLEEQELTDLKNHYVQNNFLDQVGRVLKLDKLLDCGASIKIVSKSMVADAVEALIGAMFIDSGCELISIRKFVVEFFIKRDPNPKKPENYKNILQKLCDEKKLPRVEFKLINSTGQAHIPEYSVSCLLEIDGELFRGAAKANRIKQAENDSARDLVNRLRRGRVLSEPVELDTKKKLADFSIPSPLVLKAEEKNIDKFSSLSVAAKAAYSSEKEESFAQSKNASMDASSFDSFLSEFVSSGKFVSSSSSPSWSAPPAPVGFSAFGGSAFNYKGALKEYCDKKRIKQAVFVELAREGADHMPVFQVKVSLEMMSGKVESALGKGSTKKEAERNAAKGLVDFLHSVGEL